MQFPRTTKILDKGCDAIVNAGSATVKLLDIATRSIDSWDAHQQRQLQVDNVRFNYDLANQLCEINSDAQKMAKEYGEEAWKNAMKLVHSWDPDFKELALDPTKPAEDSVVEAK